MRIAHLSDLHFGHHDADVARDLAADISSQRPDLVVVSGDFTQVGTQSEFKEARAFLDSLSAPVFAVPGNHDVPAVNLLRRFVDPYGLYRKYICREVEPFLEIGGVALAGLRTSRRMRMEFNWGHGSLAHHQLDTLAERFAAASPDAVRIIVAHHPLLFPETPMQRKMKLVTRADAALQTFGHLGVRLVLSGHFHLSYVRRHEHRGQVKSGMPPGPRQAAVAPILIVQAASTISTRLRGEPNSYNLVDIVSDMITISVREWQGSGWSTRERATEPA